MNDIEVTKHLLYLLVTLDIVGYESAMHILRRPGYGGPTTMLCFLLKNAELNKKNVVYYSL
jgi:hypothetical protein